MTTSEDQIRDLLATGEKSGESNCESFLFQRTDPDDWKIARHMFNKPE